jgi:hypothetical protein
VSLATTGTPLPRANQNKSVLGIFTNDGNVILQPDSTHTSGIGANLAIDAAIAAFDSNPKNNGGRTEGAILSGEGTPQAGSTLRLVGARIQSNIANIQYRKRAIFFAPRLDGGQFAPPFFPGIEITPQGGDLRISFPGEGANANIDKQWFFVPDGYAVLPLTNELNFGIGGFAHYGLGLRWEDPETAPTRFVSQNAVIRSLDVNPVFSYRLFPQLTIAAGADYRFSKVQLERNQAFFNPFSQSFQDVAHIKLNSDLLSNGGWGWNAGIMFKPVGRVGDSSIIGSGGYADNDSAAVSCTGEGEAIMRLVLGKWAVDRVADGSTPQEAAEAAIARLGERVHAQGGLILLDRLGRPGVAFNAARMAWGIRSTSDATVEVSRFEDRMGSDADTR